jgi:hypothetical protein
MLSLLIFVLVVTIDVVGLLLDLYLWATNRTTITQYVGRFPSLGGLILLWQSLGLVALAAHFLGAP